jgi:hypothetical protein
MAADEDEPKGGQRQKPPVTIDLAVEPAKPDRPAEPPRSGRRPEPPPPPPPPPPSSSSAAAAKPPAGGDEPWRQSALAGLAGAVIALVVVFLLQTVGLWPAPGRSAANEALEQAKAASETAGGLDRRIAAVETMTETLPAIRTELKALNDKVAALDSIRGTAATRDDLAALSQGVAALGKRVDGLPKPVTQSDLTALTERVARLEVGAASGGGTPSEAVNALAAQLSDSEAQVKALTERVAAAEAKLATPVVASGGEAATRGLAVAALRRGAQGGMPFADDVDMVAALGIAADDIATLRPYAAKGVADASSLAAEFPVVAEAILAATAANDPGTGILQRIFSSLVSIRPAGPVAGNDPPAIVSRMKDDVSKGDFAGALAERDALPAAGRDASAAWAAKAADRVALDRLVDKIARTLDPPKAG